MLRSILTIAFRSLLRKKMYSLINIVGLAIGLSACTIIALFITDELSYDRFHTKRDRVVRIVHDVTRAGVVLHSAMTPAPLAPALQTAIADIESIVRVYRVAGKDDMVQLRSVSTGKKFKESNVLVTEPAFFDVFSFPLLNGNPSTALSLPFSIILTETTARKYFGSNDPMGQIFTSELGEFTVTGIMQDLPEQSHIQCNVLASLSTFEKIGGFGWMFPNWFTNAFYTYAVVREGVSLEQIQASLTAIGEPIINQRLQKDNAKAVLMAEALGNIYLRSGRESPIGPTGTMMAIWVFSAIGIVTLLLGAINFVNLATARSSQRGKEIGIRKTLGAQRKELIWQFLAEAVVTALLAMVIAGVMCELTLPMFSAFIGKKLSLFQMVTLPIGAQDVRVYSIVLLCVLSISVGVVAGSYPAFVLSGFQPALVLKSYNRTASTVLLRKGLVILQFMLSSGLIIATLIVYHQLNYMQSRDTGYTNDAMAIFEFEYNADAVKNASAMKSEMLKEPFVAGITISGAVPTGNRGNWLMTIERGSGLASLKVETEMFMIDDQYLSEYGLNIVAGRGYQAGEPLVSKPTEYGFNLDCSDGILINETAAKRWGFAVPDDAIGKRVTNIYPFEGTIIGVVKDFHSQSLQKAIEPLALRIFPGQFNFMSVRMKSNDGGISDAEMQQRMKTLETIWTKFVPDLSPKYNLLSERMRAQYRIESRLGILLTVFAGLAIVIACLGLFALAAHSAEQRTKEIGIRKVLGASTSSIVLLLTREFLLLVGLALVITVPFVWFGMSRWLKDFAYHIEIGAGVFFVGGLLAVLIAFTTVATQAFSTASAHPVESLRSE